IKAEELLKHDREVFQKLQQIFGSEHTLWQKKFLVKVPVDRPILSDINRAFSKPVEGEMFSPKDLPNTDQAWTLVTIQERAEIPSEYFSPQVSSGFELKYLPRAMKSMEVREQYSYFTDALTSGERAARTDMSQDALLHFFFGTSLEKLLDKAKDNPGLLEAMKDFAAKATRFTEETGEIVDISGQDNIVFFQKDGVWTYRLIDPVYLIQRFIVPTAHEVAERSLKEKKRFETLEESNAVAQMANYTRTINALTKFAGGTEYIDFLPDSGKKHAYLSVLNPNRNFEKS
ncbi:hypothetical protein IT087_01655, partial [Candidatus Uhrbacteria bacterium]|nr:hypothetical protein [Candidatus Uhrbacteria bacterium]